MDIRIKDEEIHPIMSKSKTRNGLDNSSYLVIEKPDQNEAPRPLKLSPRTTKVRLMPFPDKDKQSLKLKYKKHQPTKKVKQ
jgi:hypothetical protein